MNQQESAEYLSNRQRVLPVVDNPGVGDSFGVELEEVVVLRDDDPPAEVANAS